MLRGAAVTRETCWQGPGTTGSGCRGWHSLTLRTAPVSLLLCPTMSPHLLRHPVSAVGAAAGPGWQSPVSQCLRCPLGTPNSCPRQRGAAGRCCGASLVQSWGVQNGQQRVSGETEARGLSKNVCPAVPHLLSAGRAGRCWQITVSALIFDVGRSFWAVGIHGCFPRGFSTSWGEGAIPTLPGSGNVAAKPGWHRTEGKL